MGKVSSRFRLDMVKLLRKRPEKGQSKLSYKEILNITFGDRIK